MQLSSILRHCLPMPHLVLGLDIHADDITIMYLTGSAKERQLQYLASYPLTALPKPATICQALGLKSRWYSMQAALAAPYKLIMKTHVVLPAYLSADALAQEIKLSLSSYFPEYTSAELYYDFICESVNNDMQQILVLALAKQDVAARLALAAQLGLTVRIMDLDVYAINRAISWYLPRHYPAIATALIIELQRDAGYVIVWQAGVCIFHYTWHHPHEPLPPIITALEAWQASHHDLSLELLGLSGAGAYYHEIAATVSSLLGYPITTCAIIATAGIQPADTQPMPAHGLLLCLGLGLRNQGA